MTLPLAAWIANAASSWERYLTNPKPLSLWTRTSSIMPAPNKWNWRCNSAWVTCREQVKSWNNIWNDTNQSPNGSQFWEVWEYTYLMMHIQKEDWQHQKTYIETQTLHTYPTVRMVLTSWAKLPTYTVVYWGLFSGPSPVTSWCSSWHTSAQQNIGWNIQG